MAIIRRDLLRRRAPKSPGPAITLGGFDGGDFSGDVSRSSNAVSPTLDIVLPQNVDLRRAETEEYDRQ